MHPQPVLWQDRLAAMQQLTRHPSCFTVTDPEAATPQPEQTTGQRPHSGNRTGGSCSKNHAVDVTGMATSEFLSDHATHRIPEHGGPRSVDGIE